MTPRRALSLSTFLGVFLSLPLLAQKAVLDPGLLKKAESGDAQFQLKVGEAYLAGITVPLDYSKAFSWLEKASNQGLSRAQFDLGSLYESGNGTTQDTTRAATLYRRAAEQGFAPASSTSASSTIVATESPE